MLDGLMANQAKGMCKALETLTEKNMEYDGMSGA
jgi:hypothetical protein